MKIGQNDPCYCGSGRKYKKCCASKQPQQTSRTMKRHELWRLQYRSRRYLEYLSEEDLITRFNDVFINQLLLNEELKISFHQVNEEGIYWWTTLLIFLRNLSCEVTNRPIQYPRDSKKFKFQNMI